MKSAIVFLSLVVMYSQTGCATKKLWKNKMVTRKANTTYTTIENIYFACESDKCNNVDFLIKYKVNNKDKYLSVDLPPYPQGYLLIENMRISFYVYSSLNKILNENPESKSIKARINIHSLCLPNQLYKNGINMSVYINEIDSTDTDEDGNGNNGVPFFKFKDGSPYYYGRSRIYFIYSLEHISDISNHKNWLPLISDPKDMSLNLVFYEYVEEKVYAKSALKRFILTPAAILTDILTSPFQFIGRKLMEGMPR